MKDGTRLFVNTIGKSSKISTVSAVPEDFGEEIVTEYLDFLKELDELDETVLAIPFWNWYQEVYLVKNPPA